VEKKKKKKTALGENRKSGKRLVWAGKKRGDQGGGEGHKEQMVENQISKIEGGPVILKTSPGTSRRGGGGVNQKKNRELGGKKSLWHRES